MSTPPRIMHPKPASKTKVIFTHGSDREIGRQHAEAVGGDTRQGMVGFYYSFWKRMLENKPSGLIKSGAFRLVQKLIDPLLVNQLIGHVPVEDKDRLLGVSDVTGIPYEELVIPMILPDLLPMLQAYAGRFHAVNFVDVNAPPLFGCSSFLRKDIDLWQGRNLDFPGVGYWDRFPVIQLIEAPRSLKYVGFTTAGVPIAGITGVNEAQISVALHQHYCLETSLRGQPPFVISEKILKSARNLNEALSILEQGSVASSWAFVVADGKTGDGFIYECHPKAAGIRRLRESDGTLTHANFFQTEECRRREYATTERMNWDNFSRSCRLGELVKQSGGSIQAANAVRWMSDHYDPYWQEEKIINRTVSQVYNIQSLVLNLTEMQVWMAEGDAPIHLGGYAKYNLGEIFAGREGREGEILPGYLFSNAKKREAKKSYILSFIAAFDNDFDAALIELRRCMEWDYCAEAGFVAGILYMKRAEYQKALSELNQAKIYIEGRKAEKNINVFPPEYFEIWIYLARCLDLLGNRSEAIKEYEAIALEPSLCDRNILRLAKAQGPFQKETLERILMPYSSYIPFA